MVALWVLCGSTRSRRGVTTCCQTTGAVDATRPAHPNTRACRRTPLLYAPASVEDLREEELRYIRRTGFLGLINIVIFLSSPVLVSLTAFITFVGMGNQLTGEGACDVAGRAR